MNPISVLIVDDSALMRSLIGRIIENTPGLQIADKAMNGQFALQKIPLCNPDVIVLDIEMPVMNGIQFLQERKRLGIDIPVVILSSIAKEGAKVTMDCLKLGASDFVTKPSGSESIDISSIATILANLLIGFGRQYQSKKRRAGIGATSAVYPPRTQAAPPTQAIENADNACSYERSAVERLHGAPPKCQSVIPIRSSASIQIIAIGISTGGPNALREMFAHIDATLPQPIVVVQHMPAGFTEEFANSLNIICGLEVKEAKDGDILKSGRVLIAPGDRHIIIEKKALAYIIHLSDDPQRNGHRPSVDVLFESVAKVYQNHALGIIMTGMGRDGAAMLAELRRQGSRTIGQDEESSVVYGMPKVAFELGAVETQLPLHKIAETINQWGHEFS